jgi:hypothetical protein
MIGVTFSDKIFPLSFLKLISRYYIKVLTNLQPISKFLELSKPHENNILITMWKLQFEFLNSLFQLPGVRKTFGELPKDSTDNCIHVFKQPVKIQGHRIGES